MPSQIVKRLASRLYPQGSNESELLDAAVRARLTPVSRVLDIGCGGGVLYPYDYRSTGRLVIGIDLDDAIWGNRMLDGATISAAESLPFKSDTFDVVYSRYVFEHLSDPAAVLCEIARVLKVGGSLVILTPNLIHYVPAIARATPASFHKIFNARARGRSEDDTFPTLYRANTARRLSRLARLAGLRAVEVRMLETRPNYLMWSLPSFLLGVAYERIVNAFVRLEWARINILATYEKAA